MALQIRKGHLWRREIDNKPGTFAAALEPFSKAGQNLQIVMGYAKTAEQTKGAIEIYPVTDEKGKQSAQQAGLHEMTETVCLIIEGDDKAGTAYNIAKAIADAGINLHFAMCQSVDKRFQACFGFGNDSDADKAQAAISKL